MKFAAILGLCALLGQSMAWAESPDDPLFWLGRIASANQRLNYAGTLVYHSGKDIETLRIAHRTDADGEHERLEALDGQPREVTRTGTEVRCALPEQKTVIIDQAGKQRDFQVRTPTSVSALAENYRIRKGNVGRVAGREAQAIVLEPKDDLRYGYVLWAELQSGLLLKSRMLDERGNLVEQVAFSDIEIGGDIGSDQLKTRYAHIADWRIVNARASEMAKAESGWAVRTPLPGFSLVSTVRRPLNHDRGDMVHMVFSDGLSTISVFIEPLTGNSAQDGHSVLANGAVNVYRRTVAGHLLVALGEVPLRAVQQLGDSIEPAVP